MNFILMNKHYTLSNICAKATKVFRNESFHQDLKALSAFELSEDIDGGVTGSEVSQMIRETYIDCHVRLYRPWNPWSRVNGYFNPGKSTNSVYLNRWNLKRGELSVFKTIVHEAIHLIDFHKKDSYFGHGNNSPIGKSETAPWKIARIASNYL